MFCILPISGSIYLSTLTLHCSYICQCWCLTSMTIIPFLLQEKQRKPRCGNSIGEKDFQFASSVNSASNSNSSPKTVLFWIWRKGKTNKSFLSFFRLWNERNREIICFYKQLGTSTRSDISIDILFPIAVVKLKSIFTRTFNLIFFAVSCSKKMVYNCKQARI